MLVDTLRDQRQLCQLLIDCLRQGDLENENLLDYSISLFFDMSSFPHSATYKSLTSSDQLQAISDLELRKSLVDHYDISYTQLRMLDEFTNSQACNYRTPYLHDNLEYARGRIKNTKILKSSNYANLAYSAFHFLEAKITSYQKTEVGAELLLQDLEIALKK